MSTTTSRSAISTVKHSGFDLVPRRKRTGKRLTERDFAKQDWEPWVPPKGQEPGKLVPTNDDMQRLVVTCRIAYLTMLKSRDELIALHTKMKHNLVDELMADLAATCEQLKSLAMMTDAAYLRVLASACAHKVAKGKFRM
jgi:hypothetical protein